MATSLIVAMAALGGCGALVDGRADRIEAAAEAAYPPEGRFVEVDGQRVHYVEAGQGPDLVLIHGASGSTRDFTIGFIDRLTDRYRVIAFDRPGLGYTDRVSDAFGGPFDTTAESPQQQAAFLKKAADEIGVRRPIVLGHSYGGAVAMAWALDQDPAAAVIVSGATEPWPGGLGFLYGLTASSVGGAAIVPLITAFAGKSQVEAALREIFRPNPVPPGYLERIGWPLTLRRATFRANARQVDSLRPHVVAMSERYATLDLPLEIVHGKADEVVPPDIHSEVLAKQVKGAHLVLLDDVGHMPHHVQPQAVVDAIDRAARRAGLR
ncbi:alpha/beta fold hydrolase [Oceaniglobus roseus]|uniref:alpha/beta fold hydrolase n=1 Tax=Oceaniglobus roseus TaxID=1737570 RepID=UPI001FE8031A|nr:alpha/beta hydrolase [Kandeliimicrobium roseum]